MPLAENETPIPVRRFRWRRFFLGFLAPVLVPVAAVALLGGHAEAWVFIVAWGVPLIVGLHSGVKGRGWAFLLGMLAAVAVFLVLLLLNRLGWWPW